MAANTKVQDGIEKSLEQVFKIKVSLTEKASRAKFICSSFGWQHVEKFLQIKQCYLNSFLDKVLCKDPTWEEEKLTRKMNESKSFIYNPPLKYCFHIKTVLEKGLCPWKSMWNPRTESVLWRTKELTHPVLKRLFISQTLIWKRVWQTDVKQKTK